MSLTVVRIRAGECIGQRSLATIVMARTEHAVDLPALQSALQRGPDEGTQVAAL